MLECGDIRENIDFNLHIFGFRDVPSKWRRWHGRKRIKSYEKAFFDERQCVALIMPDISLG